MAVFETQSLARRARIRCIAALAPGATGRSWTIYIFDFWWSGLPRGRERFPWRSGLLLISVGSGDDHQEGLAFTGPGGGPVGATIKAGFSGGLRSGKIAAKPREDHTRIRAPWKLVRPATLPPEGPVHAPERGRAWDAVAFAGGPLTWRIRVFLWLSRKGGLQVRSRDGWSGCCAVPGDLTASRLVPFVPGVVSRYLDGSRLRR